MRFAEDTNKFTFWNFGDAEEQSAAMIAGDKGKLAKATKKIDKLLLTRCDELRMDASTLKTSSTRTLVLYRHSRDVMVLRL